MTDLATLSMARAGLPSFPGSNLAEQLIAGRDQALAALRQYVPNLAFDPAGAQAVLNQVSAWEERNRNDLSAVLADPSVEALPGAVQISFGSDKAQQYVIAVFTQAAAGLGPWSSGRVASEVNSGQIIQSMWAKEDAQARLNVFGSIVKMQTDGYLRQLFQPPGSGTQGFGIAPVIVWAIAITVVALAAVILMQLYAAKKLEANNKTMTDLCKKAQADGDTATVSECIKAAADLQQGSIFPGLEGVISNLWKVGAVALVGYIMIKWGLPALQSHGERRGRR
jgi:hypothetical protein